MSQNMSEFKLKVGKKGEIYTTSKLRKILNLKPGGTVIAKVVGGGKVLLEDDRGSAEKTQESKA